MIRLAIDDEHAMTDCDTDVLPPAGDGCLRAFVIAPSAAAFSFPASANHTSGIYCIRNNANGMIYIGQSCRIHHRWAQHLRLLRSGKHCNNYLQYSFSKHGESVFSYSIIEFVQSSKLDEREVYWIRKFGSCDQSRGYNIFEGGLGKSFVPKNIREKISKALKGMKRSPESVAKSAAGNRGKKRSEQARKNMTGRRPGPEERMRLSLSQKGRVITQETRDKISATLKKQSDRLRDRMIGTSPSAESRRKISLALTGRKQSAESNLKRAAWSTGRTLSQESKDKISAFHKGKQWNLGSKRSAETRAMLSEKAKLREARKRAQCLTNNNA